MSSPSQWIPDTRDLKKKYEEYSPHFRILLYRLEDHLRNLIQVSARLSYKTRIKNFESYYTKLLKCPLCGYADDLPVLSDILGVRIICPFMKNAQEVLGVLTRHFTIIEIDEKGVDRGFSEFGYESIHVLAEIPESFKVGLSLPPHLVFEIQIRTILQDAWAEVEHELVYKCEFSPLDLPLKRKLASINASLCLADLIFQDLRDYQTNLNNHLDARRSDFYSRADEFTDTVLSDAVQTEKRNHKPIQSVCTLETIDSLILQAIEAHNAEDFPTAEAIYTRIINQNPDKLIRSLIYKHRGVAFFAQGFYEKAYIDFCASFEANPENFRAYYYGGIVLMMMNKNADAIAFFTKSLEINMYQSHVYYRRALAYFCEGDIVLSLQDLDKAVALGLPLEDERKLRAAIAKKIDMV